MLRTLTHAQLRNQSAAVLRDIERDRQPRLITNHGKPVAILYPATEAEIERAESGIPIVQPAVDPAEIAQLLEANPPTPLPAGETTQQLLDWVRG